MKKIFYSTPSASTARKAKDKTAVFAQCNFYSKIRLLVPALFLTLLFLPFLPWAQNNNSEKSKTLSNNFNQAQKDFLQLSSGFNQIQSDFVLTLQDSHSINPEPISGNFSLLRPSYFRYRDQEQKIVSDGKKVFYFYPDLMQVMERNLSEVEKDSPMLILVKNPKNLLKTYSIFESKEERGHFRLSSDGELIESIEFWFNLKTHLLTDVWMNYNSSMLAHFQLKNTKHVQLHASDFKFVLPKGADIIESS